MPLIPGARFGRYEVVGLLGKGGMGEVYKVRDTRLDRTVAIKALPAHLADDSERRARFDREARAIAALSHPSICTIHDVFHDDDRAYLVMEYIDGLGADELVSRHGPLGVAEACEIARQAAHGLAYIHEHNMVHRDIKPSNLMLTLVEVDDAGGGWHAQRLGDGRGYSANT